MKRERSAIAPSNHALAASQAIAASRPSLPTISVVAFLQVAEHRIVERRPRLFRRRAQPQRVERALEVDVAAQPVLPARERRAVVVVEMGDLVVELVRVEQVVTLRVVPVGQVTRRGRVRLTRVLPGRQCPMRRLPYAYIGTRERALSREFP